MELSKVTQLAGAAFLGLRVLEGGAWCTWSPQGRSGFSIVYGPAPILASGLSFLICEMGVQCLDPPGFRHVGGHGGAWLCPQQSCWLQPSAALHVPPPRYSLLLAVLLTWHLEVLGDKQCHLSEDHGKSWMGGASRWVCPIGRVAHGPRSLVREAVAEPGAWNQADGSPGRIHPFAFDQWGCGSFQSPHVLLLG